MYTSSCLLPAHPSPLGCAVQHLHPRLDVLAPIYRSTLQMIFGSRPAGEELYPSPSNWRRAG